MRPVSALSATMRSIGSRVDKSARIAWKRAPASRQSALRLLHGGAADRNDGRARLCERHGDTLTQASIGAGHDGILAGKVEGVRHRRSLTAGFP